MQICKTNKIVKGKRKRNNNDGDCLLLLGFNKFMELRMFAMRFGGEWWKFGGVSDVVHRSF
ncbi:hypothetical protein KY285_004720 [Solanum tuberosum]|nr:hypothetical protein KY285_004720 [Solanum tuberosum]